MSLALATAFADPEIAVTVSAAGSRAGLESMRELSTGPYLMIAESGFPEGSRRAEAALGDGDCREIWLVGSGEPEGEWAAYRRAGRVEWLSFPLTLRELVSCFENVRRRNEAGAVISLPGGLPYEPRTRRVGRAEPGCELTEKEAALVEALVSAGDEGIDRARLLEMVWRYVPGIETHTLETHVYRLRQKLDPIPGSPVVLAEQGNYRLAARRYPSE